MPASPGSITARVIPRAVPSNMARAFSRSRPVITGPKSMPASPKRRLPPCCVTSSRNGADRRLAPFGDRAGLAMEEFVDRIIGFVARVVRRTARDLLDRPARKIAQQRRRQKAIGVGHGLAHFGNQVTIDE